MTDAVKKTVEAPKAVVAKAKVIPAPKPRVMKKAVKPAAPVEKAVPEVVPGIKANRSVSKPAQEEVNDKEELPVSKKVKREEWDDLDTPEMGDPSMMAEYAVEIFEYMKVLEVSLPVFFIYWLRKLKIRASRTIKRFKRCPIPTTWTTKRNSNGKCERFLLTG